MTGVAYMPSRIFLSDSMPNDSVKSHRWFYLQQWEQWHNMCQWRINWFWLSGKQMCVICVKIVMSLLTWHVFIYLTILTTNLAACVCVCATFYQCLPLRSYFVSKRPDNFVRIAKFPYAAFGPLFAFHCPLFFTRNNNLQCKSSRFAVVVRSSVADRQLHLNGVIRSAGVAEWQELGPKT